MKTYEIEITTKVVLEITAECEEQAVSEACQTAWQYDPDDQLAKILKVTDTEE